jgi:serine/threonine-protein kinase
MREVEGEASSAIDVRPLNAGGRLGRYEIVRRIAVGGMAELYLARSTDPADAEPAVAVKRVHPHLSHDPEFVAMFVAEARIAATLHHPNIVRVLDLGTHEDEHFFAMEYLHGENVRSILREASHRGGVPFGCALSIVIGAARGLHHAHEQSGVVHRDVSPSNVIVTFAGDVKVVDFGIAKVFAQTRQTQAGVLKGKIGYMSPEQCSGTPVDRRSDVFGLGILLYELTTGQRLFYAENQFAVMNKIVTGAFDPPSAVVAGYPPALERIVVRALAVEPDHRFPTAQAVQNALEDFADAEAVRMGPVFLAQLMRVLFGPREFPRIVLAPRPRRPAAKRRSTGLTIAALAGIPVALGVGIALGGGVPDEPPPSSTPVMMPAPPPAPVPIPVVAATELADDAEPDVPPPAERVEKKPKRKARKKRGPSGRAPAPAADERKDPLFPPAYYGRK